MAGEQNTAELVRQFLASPAFAVVGASDDPAKFGHRCFAALLRYHRRAFPVNPNAATVLGHPVFPDLRSLPEPVEAVSIITPPRVTERVVEDAIAAGVRRIWMQPGAESAAAVQRARDAGIDVLHSGPCLLVELPQHG
ncbi:MAG: yccU [Armatimonadetes bacterium]|jgi:predicted CoA-binding protein|nr:yccU [Armatimonadota bacterium]